MDERPLDKSYFLSYLQNHSLAILSTVNPRGLPDAAPIYYTIKYTFDIFFMTPAKTQKVANIEHQNDVLLTILDDAHTETMQIRGIATEEEHVMEETLSGLAKKLDYRANFIQSLPLSKHKNQPVKIMKISPYEIRLRRYGVTTLTEKVLRKVQGDWDLAI